MTPAAAAQVAVDCVVFGVQLATPSEPEGDDRLLVLLVERDRPPFAGQMALPGGFVLPGEELEAAAQRELAKETGVEQAYLEQLYTFGSPERDPRGRVVTVAWMGLVKPSAHRLMARTDARDARWVPLREVPPLAFDHDDILAVAHERLCGKLRYKPIGLHLLPDRFTLTWLQRLYEVILERPLDKRNFRRKVEATGLVVQTSARLTGVPHRAPRLYRFDHDRYTDLERTGLLFEL